MKQKISISIEKETLERIEILLKNPNFRNKSHIVEIAVNKFCEDKNE